LQQNEGILTYSPGNILSVHLDKSKTKYAFDKRRRAFDYLAIFKEYVHGNARIELLTNQLKKFGDDVEVPIYFTFKVAENLKDLVDHHRNIINNMEDVGELELAGLMENEEEGQK
jgi:hypothetical protein